MNFCVKKRKKKKEKKNSLIALIILNNNLSIILLKNFQTSEQVHYIVYNLASTETDKCFSKVRRRSPSKVQI